MKSIHESKTNTRTKYHSKTIHNALFTHPICLYEACNLCIDSLGNIYARDIEDICAKYGRSSMNDAHTISPTDFVGLPVKIVRLTAFFLDS